MVEINLLGETASTAGGLLHAQEDAGLVSAVIVMRGRLCVIFLVVRRERTLKGRSSVMHFGHSRVRGSLRCMLSTCRALDLQWKKQILTLY